MLNDALFLLKHGRWHSAVYLAGYAVECRLKAAVCQFIGARMLPVKLQTHDLWTLLVGAGLEKALQSNQQMRTYFNFIESVWDVEIRYAAKPYGRNDAEKFLDTVRRFVKWLNAIFSRMT
jgi:HEPN domain-containing protein